MSQAPPVISGEEEKSCNRFMDQSLNTLPVGVVLRNSRGRCNLEDFLRGRVWKGRRREAEAEVPTEHPTSSVSSQPLSHLSSLDLLKNGYSDR